MIDERYEIVSIEPTEPPGDLAGTGWQCYIIQQGQNRIHGYQQGTARAVTQAVEEIVARLNEQEARLGAARSHWLLPGSLL